jgi:hypothetical protein
VGWSQSYRTSEITCVKSLREQVGDRGPEKARGLSKATQQVRDRSRSGFMEAGEVKKTASSRVSNFGATQSPCPITRKLGCSACQEE